MDKDGLITVQSRFGVTETIDRLADAIEGADPLVVARIDHATGSGAR